MAKLTKIQFQEKHKLTDQEMEKLDFVIKTFNGRIVAIKEIQGVASKEGCVKDTGRQTRPLI